MDTFKWHVIKQRREHLKLTQLDLSFLMHQLGQKVTPSSIHQWEHGLTSPDANKVPTLAKALQLPTEDLYG